MSLSAGDLTTPARVTTWAGSNGPSGTLASQLITSMTQMIYSKLNRARTYSQSFTRTIDGVGTMQLVLPDFPVTSITSLQIGNALIPPAPLSSAVNGVIVPSASPNPGYGYRFVPWGGNLPGDICVVEFLGGYFWTGVQNIKVQYQAGYVVSNEPWEVPNATPATLTVLQPLGLWCRDNGVSYAGGGALTPVMSQPQKGQYIPPSDANPGLYTFSPLDSGANVLISYSFIPADLEEACIQMVMERYSYRNRIGTEMQMLGGQESARFMRGGLGRGTGSIRDLPPEVAALIEPYVSTVPPAIGAPV